MHKFSTIKVLCYIQNSGGGSNFTLVRPNFWTLLNAWKTVATNIYTQLQATCTAQSTISMQGILMLEDLRACALQENFEKQVATLRLNLGTFQDLTIAICHFN